MTQTRHMSSEVICYGPPRPRERDPAHAPIDWFETDYDDQFTDPDAPDPPDPLPTERHRKVVPK